MAEPRCPSCQAEGMDLIVSKDSRERGRNGRPWFNVVHCDACGHVYGVFAKHVLGQRGGPQLVVEGRRP
jgi:uncharacterized Zn finger protein